MEKLTCPDRIIRARVVKRQSRGDQVWIANLGFQTMVCGGLPQIYGLYRNGAGSGVEVVGVVRLTSTYQYLPCY
jgi:hypothetical protein